jgi:hypothetical protein
VYLQTSLFTDDTFKFNEVVKELNGLLIQLPTFDPKFNTESTAEQDNFLPGLKRRLFLETMRMLFNQFKHKTWATANLTQCIRGCYLQREKFSEPE